MAESIPSADDDAQRAIQALSEKLDVPELKVLECTKPNTAGSQLSHALRSLSASGDA